MEPKRKRVRQMPSKEEVLGAQKAKELGLEPGMKVTLMDTKDKCVIKRICPDHAEIEIDEVYALRSSWAPGIPGVTVVTIK